MSAPQVRSTYTLYAVAWDTQNENPDFLFLFNVCFMFRAAQDRERSERQVRATRQSRIGHVPVVPIRLSP